MLNKFTELTKRIAAEFPSAREHSIAGHDLAKAIRNEWSDAARGLALPHYQNKFEFVSSPGVGQWNAAPWLAVLLPSITKSAQAGYYPVYLFEPGFRTVCLVMGQGAERLEQAVGKSRAIAELKKRADKLRNASEKWISAGFNAGPFQTTRDSAAKQEDKGKARLDPWAVSVAFGVRYDISALPTEEVMKRDLNKMLAIYSQLAKDKSLSEFTLDEMLADMAASGELPLNMEGGVDGAKRVAYHKRYEYRHRNKALINRVKKKLGSTCQACSFRFDRLYGSTMEGFIEAHHKVPISTLSEAGEKLEPTEDHFMVLCSNCHQAIHAAGCPDLETFKATLQGTFSVANGVFEDPAL